MRTDTSDRDDNVRSEAVDAPAGPDLDEVALIDQRLKQDDPELVRRMERLERADAANAMIVVSLLVVAAVLLAVGLARQAWLVWYAGGLSFLASFAVDAHYRRRLRR